MEGICLRKLSRRGIVHYSTKNSEEYAQDIALPDNQGGSASKGLQQQEPNDSSAVKRRQPEQMAESSPQTAPPPDQEAAVSLSQAQYRLSKEIENALQKLRQVITESENLVNRVSHMKQNQD